MASSPGVGLGISRAVPCPQLRPPKLPGCIHPPPPELHGGQRMQGSLLLGLQFLQLYMLSTAVNSFMVNFFHVKCIGIPRTCTQIDNKIMTTMVVSLTLSPHVGAWVVQNPLPIVLFHSMGRDTSGSHRALREMRNVVWTITQSHGTGSAALVKKCQPTFDLETHPAIGFWTLGSDSMALDSPHYQVTLGW